jgi:hypothetical protein
MHRQLQAVVDEFASAERRLDALLQDLPADRWARRSDPARWSVAECIAHLNMTSQAFLPRLREAVARARALQRPAPARYRRDPMGWLLWKIMPPPVRMRVKTTAAFVPGANLPRDEVVAEFRRLQADQIACVRDADGLPISEVRVPSPFRETVTYNVFSALTILPRHQHRHLWQAEQVWASAVPRN